MIIVFCIFLTDSQIVISDEASYELAVKQIVRRVDSAHAVVRIVACAHAEAERTCCPERGRAPVLVVVTEAIHTL